MIDIQSLGKAVVGTGTFLEISGTAIAGLIVACLALGLLVGFLCLRLYKRKNSAGSKKKRNGKESDSANPEGHSSDKKSDGGNDEDDD